MSAALELNGVTKRYGRQTAVDALSFSVPKGRICGFLGPNGAGKTSTIRMVLGLSEPTSGTLSVLGAPDGRKVRDRIGFLPEERGLYKKMNPVDTIAYFAALKGVPTGKGRRKARELLERLGLKDSARKPMKALSKGMAQKVQLMCAVAHDPELVILDEPFSGLDPVNQQVLETEIRSLADRGATVIFSTHVMQHAERLCDQVVLLSGGRKVYDGDLEGARAAAPRLLVVEGALDAAAVSALPGVASVQTEALEEEPGAFRHRAVLQRGAAAPDAIRAAFDRDLDLRRFEVKEPTLHDAFIVLTGGRDASVQAGA
jgi:ABC-2 type transport system ATP-binding protein